MLDTKTSEMNALIVEIVGNLMEISWIDLNSTSESRKVDYLSHIERIEECLSDLTRLQGY